MSTEFNNKKISVNKAEEILNIDLPKEIVITSSTIQKNDSNESYYKYKPYCYTFVLTIPGDTLTNFTDYISQSNFADISDTLNDNCSGTVTAREIIGYNIVKIFERMGNACQDGTGRIPVSTTIYIAKNDLGDGILYVTYN